LAVTDQPKPKAKTERLIVREIDGETLVYDHSRYTASCLNEFAARVWRECDGETSVAEIAAARTRRLAGAASTDVAFPPDMSAAKSRSLARVDPELARAVLGSCSYAFI
jgi:hypothetical protein